MAEIVKERTVFLLGPTGVGKSALGNELIDPGDEDDSAYADAFSVGSGTQSETLSIGWRETILRYVSHLISNGNPEPIMLRLRVTDSPGLSDTGGRSTTFLDDIMNAIRESRPHGVIIVTQAGRDSHEFQLSLRALSECLGTSVEDTRRVALFVNKLPTDFQFRQQKPPIKNAQKQNEKRLDIVEQVRIRASELLRLKPSFCLRTAIGNTFGTFDGVDNLRDFIAEMPDDPMDITKIRTWTEARSQARAAVLEAEAQARMVKRRILDLKSRVSTLEQNIAHYETRMGNGYAITGFGTVCVTAVAQGATLFVPGLNLTTLAAGTAAIAGSLIGGKAAVNIIDSWRLPEALEQAKQELHDFLEQRPETQIKQEVKRLKFMLLEIEDLQTKIDSHLHAKL